MHSYHCVFCGENVSLKNMNLHLRAKHADVEKKYTCAEDNCLKVFNNCKSFKNHLKSTHSINSTTNLEKNLIVNRENEITSKEEIPVKINDTANSNDVGVLDAMLKFVLHLYGLPNMPRSTATKILNLMWTLIVLEYTKFIKARLDPSISSEIDCIFQTYEQFFKSVDTEHKLLKLLEAKGLFIAPKTVILKTKLQTSYKKGVPILKTIQTSAVIISLAVLFKKILELPDTFSRIISYIEILKNSTTFTSFMQSPLWKSKISNMGNSLVLPYFLYFDDYVSDNPLGPKNKCHSMASVYILLPFLPIEIESKLDNIFLFYLFKTKNKVLGNKLIFAPTIDEMKILEEKGINISIGGQIHNVKFVMGLTIGDNLGMNEILGFVKCFRANHPCRLCKIKKEDLVKCCREDSTLMRNEANYEEDVMEHNVSATGVHERCVFNEIPSFNVCENYSFDIMHDLLEGVFHYDLAQIFKYLFSKKFLTLETLNDCRSTFDYGPMQIGNLTELITKEHIKKSHFRFTSSEMLCFVQNLPLMIGKYVPEDDDVWLFFLDLLKILDIVMSGSVIESDLIYLDSLIFAHHNFYVNFFKEELKFKHHNMIHYSTVIRKIGPLKKIWCIRLEGKHKELKSYGKNITSRKNLALSITIKEQLKLSNRFFSNSVINWNKISLGSKVSNMEFKKYGPTNLPAETKYYKWLKYNGIKYESNLVIPFDEEDCNVPKISRILCCFVINEAVGLIIKNDVETMGYNEHYHCFVARCKETNEIGVINIKNSAYAPSFLHKLPDSTDYGFLLQKF
jgi:hypothetical protein